MKKRQPKPTKSKLPLAVAAACGFASGAVPQAVAQDAAEPTKEKVVVTGSNIPTADTVTVAPVAILRSEQIEQLGVQDVLQTIRKLDASFGGNGNVGQTINNRTQGGGEANIAIRNLPTLVLLDGRRLANSAFSNGAAVDVNAIPLAMIDRIEILKDGGSTFYGSDAIGGVVNIITKKNFDGAEVSGRFGFPTRTDSNDVMEYRASIVAGTSTEKGFATAGGSYYRMDPLLTRDRPVASAEAVDLVNRGIALPTYFSGSFPGRVGNDILAGSPFLQGSPRFNATWDGSRWPAGGPFTLAQLEGLGVYVPIDQTPLGALLRANGIGSRVLLNTTRFGTYSIQKQDRRNAFFNFEHDLIGKEVQAFGSFFYANNMSEGVLAPSPVSALGPAGFNQISVPANNPFNPFGTALGVGGAGAPRVRTRFVEVGNRLFDSQYDYYRLVGGLKGTIAEDYHWEGAYTYNRSEQTQYNRNIPAGDRLNLALQPNSDPAQAALGLSNLMDANGNFVPIYNIFGLPGINNAATIAALRSTTFDSGVSQFWSVDGKVDGKVVDLPGGRLAFAVGAQYASEVLGLDSDAMLESGNAPGLNPIPSFAPRGRNRWSLFAEVLVPITSPDMNIPGLASLELTASGRHESLMPGGDSDVPKVGIRWQPVSEQVTLRASYSQSFIAPTMFALYGPPTADAANVTFPDGSGQVSAFYNSNPNLPPSEATTWNGGVVVTPECIPNLTLSVDYYNVDQDKIGATPDLNAVVADLNANGVASRYVTGYRHSDNTRVTGPNQVFFAAGPNGGFGTFSWQFEPGASQSTDGLDFAAHYRIPHEKTGVGNIALAANANYTMSYEFQGAPSLGRYNYAGFFTQGVLGAQGNIPDYTLHASLTWDYAGLSYTATAHYIPGVDAPGNLWPTTGSAVNDFTVNGQVWKVPDYWTLDMQIAYEFGKGKTERKWYDGTRIAFGVNNVMDEDPPFIAGSTEDNTDKASYDILGRFVYFEVSKKF